MQEFLQLQKEYDDLCKRYEKTVHNYNAMCAKYSGLELKFDDLTEIIGEIKTENRILKAQMEVVRMIFGEGGF